MARELTDFEKQFLLMLYFKDVYNTPILRSARNRDVFSSEARILIEVLPNINRDAFVDDFGSSGVSTLLKVSILKRRGLTKSKRLRFESGYGSVAEYYYITEQGKEFIKPFFDDVYQALSGDKRACLEKIKPMFTD